MSVRKGTALARKVEELEAKLEKLSRELKLTNKPKYSSKNPL